MPCAETIAALKHASHQFRRFKRGTINRREIGNLCVSTQKQARMAIFHRGNCCFWQRIINLGSGHSFPVHGGGLPSLGWCISGLSTFRSAWSGPEKATGNSGQLKESLANNVLLIMKAWKGKANNGHFGPGQAFNHGRGGFAAAGPSPNVTELVGQQGRPSQVQDCRAQVVVPGVQVERFVKERYQYACKYYEGAS